MVRHGDGGKGYSHLNYKSRPYSEYRTFIHILVQMLQPQMDRTDQEGWQHVADLWNHIFAADLQQQNARPQEWRHWRDQYVHREAAGRPAEWKQICRPDGKQTAEEMTRREGYTRRIADAARDLSIQLPTGAVSPILLSAAPAKRKNIPAPADEALSTSLTPQGPQTQRRAKHTAINDQVPAKKSANDKDEKVIKSGKNWLVVEEADDGDKPNTFEHRFMQSLPKRKYVESSSDEDDRLTPEQRFEAAVRRKYGARSSATRATRPEADDEALARSLQGEYRKETAPSGGPLPKPDVDDDGDDSGEEEWDGTVAEYRNPSTSSAKQTPASIKKQKVSYGGYSKEAGRMLLDGDAAPTSLAPGIINNSSNTSTKGQSKMQDDASLLMRKQVGIQAMRNRFHGSKMPNSGATRPQMTFGMSGERTSRDADVRIQGRGNSVSESLIPDPPDASLPPSLLMIHGGHEDTVWINGIPHASSVSEDRIAQAPAILRPTSVVTKRGGIVLRGVIDERERDVMMCIADECSWCDPTSANSTAPSTTRPALKYPLVHACFARHNDQKGVDEFVPIEGVGFDWEDKFPNHIRSAKVAFDDGLVRDVYVCVEGKCKLCMGVKKGKMTKT